MRLTVVQMNPGANKDDNIAQARRLIEGAVAEDRPDIVSLPEVWDSLGGDRATRTANAAKLPPPASPCRRAATYRSSAIRRSRQRIPTNQRQACRRRR